MRRHVLLLLTSLLPAVAGATTLKDDSSSNSATHSSEREINCLALNIYHEARGEPHDGQLAVAYVTMNRVASPRYPQTVCEVVWQRRQFSWTHDRRSDAPRDTRAWGKAMRIASFIYNNYFRFQQVTKGATDMTKGALFYFAPRKVSPYWTKNMVATTAIGSHVFLRDDRRHEMDG